MGQRLNIEIVDGDTVLANAYYHWSAFTFPALELTAEIIKGIDKVPSENRLEQAVELLELTGAGVDDVEWARIESDTTGKFDELVSKEAKNRNKGLISVTKEGILETETWEEGRVSIDPEKKTICFDVVDCLSLEEYRADFEDAPSLPVVDGIDFYEVPFSQFHELIGIIHMYEYGIRLSNGTVVLWIDG